MDLVQKVLALWLLAGSTLSAITVTVNATSPTQAILSYAAPSTNTCTVEVSESSTYTPLVHDVDGNLFPGANLDSRAGALNSATTRILLVGTRSIQKASDSNNYSRALQQNTLHYYRVTCDDQVSTGTFTTKILPFGTTYQDLIPLNADGTYNFPTTSSVNRSEVIVDPQTGVLIRRINLPSDNGPDSAPYPTAGGFGESCSATLTAQGHYHCMFNDYPQGIYPNLYSIDPVTGEAQFLGAAYFYPSAIDSQGTSVAGVSGGGERVMWDPSDANTAYVSVGITATHRSTIVKWTYIGQDNPDSNIAGTPQQSPSTVVDLLGGEDLNTLARAFNPALDTTKFSCGVVGLQSHYFLLRCARGYQNTYAWEGAYDLGNGLPLGAGGTGRIVALAAEWTLPGSRWCGDHTYEFVGNVPVYSFALHSLTGLSSAPYDGGGPYSSTVTSAVPFANPGDLTTINVTSSWNTTWGAIPSGWAAGEPVSPNPDHFLQAVQVGDSFYVGTEVVQLVQKMSSSQWVIKRGITMNWTLPSIPAGAVIQPQCDSINNFLTQSGGYLWWDFVGSPDGTNPVDWSLNLGDHPVSRGGFRVDSGYPIRTGAVTDKTTWGKPPDMQVTAHPFFGGQSAPGDGNSYQKHVSMASGDSSTFYDDTYFVGTSLFSAQNSSATTLISGTLYQYHYDTGVAYANGTPIARKHFPTLAKTAGRMLVDVSGPGVVLSDGPSDNYHYCIANAAGECHAGSQPGDIFFNHPNLDPADPWCTGGENGTGVNDICIGNFASMGLAAMQYKVANDLTGALSYRPLGRTFQNVSGTISGNLKLTYGGEWAIFFVVDAPPPNPASRIFAFKVPPSPVSDGIDRSTFVPAVVNITAPAGLGIQSARIKFGYAEQAGNCTSRHESCVAVAEVVDPANPFSFSDTESYVPTPCAISCTIAIPVYPLHTAYYAVEFLSGDGSIVATSAGLAMENVVVSQTTSVSQTTTSSRRVNTHYPAIRP